MQKHSLQTSSFVRISTFLLIFFFSVLTLNSVAQDSLLVQESVESMSQGKQNGFSVFIPKNDEKSIQKLWKKFMDDETKSSVRKEYDELVVHLALLKSMGTDTMNVYAAFKDAEGGVMAKAFFSGTDSVFITSKRNEAQSISAKYMLRNFAVFAYKAGVEDQLKDENKKLDKMESELKDLENNVSNSESQIKKDKREIERQKSDITELQKQEEFTSGEVLKQKQYLTTFIGSAEARKTEDEKLKDLEKEKKKITRDIEKANRKIDDLEQDIKEQEKSIDKHQDKLIPEQKESIKAQKALVKSIEDLFNNIH